jgi:hypothetical protein
MPRTQVPATLPDPPAPAAALRNVFEYGPQPGDRRVSQPFPEPSAREEATPTSQPADPVRLVGLVSRGGLLRAALAIEGEVTVLAPGQQAFGYTLLSIDRDGDVRLKAPNGAEIRAAGDR